MDFGDLRMLCHEAPSPAAWRAIVATIEAQYALGGTHADEVEAVWLPYADEALERWPHASRAITPGQLKALEQGQRAISLRLARHLRWSGIWGKDDMARLAAQADLVALPSLHLYQTEEADAATLRRARPDLMAGLESLTVESSFLKPSEIAPLMAAIAQGGALRSLHVDGSYAADWLRACAEHAARLTRLTSLRFRDGKMQGDDVLPLIDDWAASGAAARLTELTMRCLRLERGAELALVRACPALTSIGMRALDLVGHDLVGAFQAAPLHQIERLDAGLYGMADADVPKLGDLIRAMPALRALNVHYTSWSSETGNVPKLAPIGVMPVWLQDTNLASSSLARTYPPGARPLKIWAGKIEELSRAFDSLDLSALADLRLTNSTCGADGLRSLAQRAFPALRELDLWGCALDDAGAQIALDAPWSKQLTTLGLHANRLTAASIPPLIIWLQRGANVRNLPLVSCSDTLDPFALVPLMEAASMRSAPLMLAADSKIGPNTIGYRCPPRADGSPWPPHIIYDSLSRFNSSF